MRSSASAMEHASHASSPSIQLSSHETSPERVPTGPQIQPVLSGRRTCSTGKRKAQGTKSESSTAGLEKRRKKNLADQDNGDAAVLVASTKKHLSWEILKPHASSTTRNKKHSIAGKPEIWASSRSDLVTIFRGLNKNVGGLSYLNFGVFPTLVWLIDGRGWPEDAWDGGTIIDLCIVVNIAQNLPPPANGEGEFNTKSMESDKTEFTEFCSDEEDIPLIDAHLWIRAPVIESTPCTFTFSDNSPILNLKHHGYTLDIPHYSALCAEFSSRNASQLWMKNHYWNEKVPQDSMYYGGLLLPEITEIAYRFNDPEQNLDLILPPPTSISVPPTSVNRDTHLHETYHSSNHGASTGFSERNIPKSCKSTPGLDQTRWSNLEATHGGQLLSSGNQEVTGAQAIPPSKKSLAEIVPVIATLLDFHENKIPIVVIAGKDASVTPSGMSAECGYSVLGFFDITSAEPEVLNRTSVDSQYFNGKVRWKVRLSYSSPGKGLGGNTKPPWWLESEPIASASANARQDQASSSSVSILVESLEGTPQRAWWHCTECGKLNIKQMFLHRRCSHCARVECPAPTVSVDNARIANKSSPHPFPSDDPPQSMKLSQPKTWPDNMRVFHYHYDDVGSVAIKHIFTCNMDALQAQATELFKQVQLTVELKWQAAARDSVTLGPYYSYSSPEDWAEAPSCLIDARELILRHAQTYCGEVGAQIKRVAVLAWTNPGSKKGSFVSAKRHPVFVLCLGADADFYIERESSSAAPPSVVKGVSNEAKLPKAQPRVSITKQAESERLRINMIHGDVLILRGDKFHYSLTRTGTSILIFGFATAA